MGWTVSYFKTQHLNQNFILAEMLTSIVYCFEIQRLNQNADWGYASGGANVFWAGGESGTAGGVLWAYGKEIGFWCTNCTFLP